MGNRFGPRAALLLAATAAGARAQAPAADRAADPRPNVLLIVADDLGSADLSCCGATGWTTPHLDALAAGGARFTRAYVVAPVCVPSRAGLLTGRYPQRFGVEFNEGTPKGVPPPGFGLPADATTLAEQLHGAGWATGLVGKWHLGERVGQRPTERGFDDFFGFLPSSARYLPPPGRDSVHLRRGLERAEEREHLTKAFTREAAAFIDRHARAPFFLCVAFNAVHSPMQGDPALAERVAQVRPRGRRDHANLVVGLDDAVGALLRKLRDSGLDEKTLVVFMSDNGSDRSESNAPLSGGKFDLHEGGLRVPLLVSFKGRVKAGTVVSRPVSTLDVAATVAAAAGDAAARFDGLDLLPLIADPAGGAAHDALFFRFGPHRAVVEGDWKLLAGESGAPQLFDLAADPAEAHDVAATQPERVARLEAAWAAWNVSNVAPRWPMKAGLEEHGDADGERDANDKDDDDEEGGR